MAFKLGREKRDFRTPNNTTLFRKSMDDGAIAQANMDGSIDVDPSVKPGSKLMKRVIKHEQKHMEQMDEGRAAYGDNWVMWEDKIYIRKNGMIDGPMGRLPEGHPAHPWEQEAMDAEKE